MKLFPLDEVPLVCANCGEEVAHEGDLRNDRTECAECYVNEECPAQCNDEHSSPEPNSGGSWTCETTLEIFYYTGIDQQRGYRNLSNWQPATRWQDDHVLINGWWFSSHEDAGLYWCDSCEEYRDEDHYHAEYDEEYRDEDDYVPSEPVVCCAGGCSETIVTHYHLITEKLYCEEHYTLMAVENRGLIPTLELVAA